MIMSRYIVSVIIGLILSTPAWSETATALYLEFPSYTGMQYTDNSAAVPVDVTISNPFGLTISLSRPNGFEVSLSLSRDLLRTATEPAGRNRTGIAAELGKTLTVQLFAPSDRPFQGEFAAGGFACLHIMARYSERLLLSYGLYFKVKARLPIWPRSWKLKSLDIGYKCSLPVHDSFYSGPVTILNTGHTVFAGVSF
jgi:hypothetical protein